MLLVIGYAVSDGTGGYSIADIANQPYYLIAVGVMVLALLLSLVMIQIEKRTAEGDASEMNTENLSALFENGAYTLVVQKNGVTVHKDFGRGVGPALRVFDAQPELLKGARSSAIPSSARLPPRSIFWAAHPPSMPRR